MSNSAIQVTAGTGTNVDTWVVGSDHQQIVVVRPYPAATATLANITAATTSTTLLASNVARLGVVVYNDSSADLYLKFGTAASTTSFTDKVPPGAVWYYPEGGSALYTGAITGVWGTAAGSGRVTELTA